MLTTTTLLDGDFAGINMGALKSVLVEKCLSRMREQKGNLELEDTIHHEYTNDMHFVYFNAIPRAEGYSKNMKRYFMIVFSCLLFDTYYFSGNVIDLKSTYTLDDVKKHFKGYAKSLNEMAQAVK